MNCENFFLNPCNYNTMNYRQYLEKHHNGALSDAEWEQLAQNMMNAHFGQEKRAAWERLLAIRGITRTPPAASRSFVFRYWSAAAAVLIAVAAVLWLFWPQPAIAPAQRLALRHLEQPFGFSQGSIRGDAATDINRGRALEAFDQREYVNAARYLRLVEAEGKAKAADYFQLGLCLLYQPVPDYHGALNAFAAARRSDASVYADETDWFSALCYLMLGDKDQAAAVLQRVAESPSSRNQQAAEELLKTLEGQ